MANEEKVTDARSRRGKSTYLHVASPQLTVRLRKIDMTTMILGSLIPWPLLQAAQKFETMVMTIRESDNKDEVAAEAMGKLDPAQLKKIQEFLRHYACVVVVEPVVVMEDDGNPDHLPVEEITGDELMSIYYAAPNKEEKPEVIPLAEAEEFRGPEPAASDLPTPDGDSVRAETVFVDYGDREAITA